jgi:hypothetical protein
MSRLTERLDVAIVAIPFDGERPAIQPNFHAS